MLKPGLIGLLASDMLKPGLIGLLASAMLGPAPKIAKPIDAGKIEAARIKRARKAARRVKCASIK